DAAHRIEVRGRRAVVDLHDPLDARHLQRFGGIEARHLAAVHGRTGDDGVEHAWQPRVDAVSRLAGGDVPAVDELDLPLADVADLLRILQAQRVACRDGLSRGGLRERAIAELPATRLMHDLVVLRFDLAHGHLPAL